MCSTTGRTDHADENSRLCRNGCGLAVYCGRRVVDGVYPLGGREMLIEITKEQKLLAIENAMLTLIKRHDDGEIPTCVELDNHLWSLLYKKQQRWCHDDDKITQALSNTVSKFVHEYRVFSHAHISYIGFKDYPAFNHMTNHERTCIRLLKLEQFRCHILYRS